MKIIHLVLLWFIPFAIYAEDPMIGAITQGAIGLLVGITIAIFIACYKGGQYLLRKIYPKSPIWAQKLTGVSLAVLLYSVWVAIAG